MPEILQSSGIRCHLRRVIGCRNVCQTLIDLPVCLHALARRRNFYTAIDIQMYAILLLLLLLLLVRIATTASKAR